MDGKLCTVDWKSTFRGQGIANPSQHGHLGYPTQLEVPHNSHILRSWELIEI